MAGATRAERPVEACTSLTVVVSDERQLVPRDVVEITASVDTAELAAPPLSVAMDAVVPPAETLPAPADPIVPAIAPRSGSEEMAAPASRLRQNLVQQMRAWLRGVAA